MLLLRGASRLDTTPLSAQLGVTRAGGSLLRCLCAWAPHRAGSDPEVLLLDVLHALIHTFVPEHLAQGWKEAGSGLSRSQGRASRKGCRRGDTSAETLKQAEQGVFQVLKKAGAARVVNQAKGICNHVFASVVIIAFSAAV